MVRMTSSRSVRTWYHLRTNNGDAKTTAEGPCISCRGPLYESQRTRWSGRITERGRSVLGSNVSQAIVGAVSASYLPIGRRSDSAGSAANCCVSVTRPATVLRPNGDTRGGIVVWVLLPPVVANFRATSVHGTTGDILLSSDRFFRRNQWCCAFSSSSPIEPPNRATIRLMANAKRTDHRWRRG